jgi:pentatricopeptide repeat protein
MSYNNIIWSAGNVGKLDIAQSLYSQLKAHKTLKPNVYTYGSLMHGCAKTKEYQRALNLLDEMDQLQISPNQIVFTSAMEACADKYKEALSVMDRMKRSGMKSDLTMVNSAIKACCLAGAMDEAESLAESLYRTNSMDLFTYHTLMMGHTKLGAYYKVMNLYEQAISSHTRLDGGVYSLAMLSALNCGSYQSVKRIAERAHSENIPLTEASYTILIQALAELKEPDNAMKCLDDMIMEGLQPNAITYSSVITALKEQPAIVLQLLDRMKKENITQNVVVLTTAINSLARCGKSYVGEIHPIIHK